MGRKIVITSGKGGVGKTTVAALLGGALSCYARVVMLDADIGLNNLDVTLGVEGKIIYDLGDILDKRCRIRQALVEVKQNLSMLASANGLPSDKTSAQHFKKIVDELATEFDFVLIDCPAGIEEGFHRAVSAANEAIVVTTPAISAVRDADKVLTLLTTYDIMVQGVIVNRVKEGFFATNGVTGREVARLLRTPFLGSVPDDGRMTAKREAGDGGEGRCSRAMQKIALTLCGTPPKDKTALFKRLLKDKKEAF